MGLNLDILSRNLKLLRTANGMSQEELADKIYLTRSTYSTYESGAKPPDLQTLDALASLYDIGFESLINYDMSKGLIGKIYFDAESRQIAELLNNYESLSVASKNAIKERLDVILEREAIFYQEMAFPKKRSD